MLHQRWIWCSKLYKKTVLRKQARWLVKNRVCITRRRHRTSARCWRSDDASKEIYILIIKVNKLFSFFSSRCFLKELNLLSPLNQRIVKMATGAYKAIREYNVPRGIGELLHERSTNYKLACGWRAGNLNWPIRIQQAGKILVPWRQVEIRQLLSLEMALNIHGKGFTISKTKLVRKKWKIWAILCFQASILAPKMGHRRSAWQLVRSSSSIAR